LPGLVSELETEDPCQQLNKKDTSSVFTSKIVDLTNKAAVQNFESAYIMYENAVEGTSFSDLLNGTPEKKEVYIDYGGALTQAVSNTIGILHCHLDDGTTFKVFSFSDIIALGEIVKRSTRPTAEFAIYVTTSSGTFAIKVNNRMLLNNKLDMLKFGQNSFEEDFENKFKITDNLETQKLGFLQFINTIRGVGNPGIDFYQKDVTTGKWNKLTLDPTNNNRIIETPCN
jgi:hypothetical protein